MDWGGGGVLTFGGGQGEVQHGKTKRVQLLSCSQSAHDVHSMRRQVAHAPV